MPLVLMIVGAVLILVGIGGVVAGAPDWLLGLSVGATLIQSGAIVLVGGVLLIGIALMLSTLRQLLERFERGIPAAPARPVANPKRMLTGPGPPKPEPRRAAPEPPHWTFDEVADEEAPPPRREPPPGFIAEDRPRRDREAPEGEPARPRRELPPSYAKEIPSRPRRDRAPDAPADEAGRGREAQAAPRRDEALQRPRRDGPAPPPPLPLPLDERRRQRGTGELSEVPPPRFRPVDPPAPAERAPAEAAVVRSGVIGGMAYTLYSDGSIEAELPIGTVRFGSIAELQEHVTRTGTEADTQAQGPRG